MQKIFFDVKELYYLPQYLPILKELGKQKEFQSKFIFYKSNFNQIVEDIISNENLSFYWVENKREALEYYLNEKPNWIIFGDSFTNIDKVNLKSKTAQIGHGIGPKKVYYDQSKTPTTVRFVESEYRLKRLSKMFPNDKFVNVGYSKLDPLVSNNKLEVSIKDLNLQVGRKTILYAPTFYPSSIEKLSKNFPNDFKDYNIILKPHYFSLSKNKYSNQRKMLEYWKRFDNVFLADMKYYSILPFLKLSDIMISDASSTMIEFAALKKPVIWCTFLKLRWNYKGLFRYRFKKRMDKDFKEYKNFTIKVESYNEMVEKTNYFLKNKFNLSKEGENNINKFLDNVDGNASKRIVTYLKENN